MKLFNFGWTKPATEPIMTDLFLRAYKPAKDLTLAERAERIISQQRFIANELKIWTWYMWDKTEIDIRDNACYDLIYKRAKKGMNTKRVERVRYKPIDTPDMQSTCIFYLSKNWPPDPFSIMHQLGWCGEYSKFECINADGFITAPKMNSQPSIMKLMNKIIDEYEPTLLYVTSKNYCHNIAKLPDDTPWTGWVTYLNNSISLPKPMLDFCEVQTKPNGTLFKVCEELFDDNNPKHVENALKLENWFKKHKIKISVGDIGNV